MYALLEADRDFLQLIDKARPHVVMLDFRFNGKGSKLVCREIKKRYPHLPVLALSSNSNIQSVYGKAGFDDYIAKPFDLDRSSAVQCRCSNLFIMKSTGPPWDVRIFSLSNSTCASSCSAIAISFQPSDLYELYISIAQQSVQLSYHGYVGL